MRQKIDGIQVDEGTRWSCLARGEICSDLQTRVQSGRTADNYLAQSCTIILGFRNIQRDIFTPNVTEISDRGQKRKVEKPVFEGQRGERPNATLRLNNKQTDHLRAPMKKTLFDSQKEKLNETVQELSDTEN